MSRTLLVTGMGRSGTSLVQKLLTAHPSICVGPQPFPDLFLAAKRSFLAGRGIDRPNPIGTRFPGAIGTIEELAEFLDADHWSPTRLDDLFARMSANSGQYMPALAAARSSIEPGPFWPVYHRLLAAMADELGCPDAQWIGSKETWFEELAAVLLARGGGAVFVIRDPRDVLTSFRYERGSQYAGAVRPTLFLLRQWRKSVAFSLHHRHDPFAVTVRYEDLVTATATALEPVAERLGVEPFRTDTLGRVVDEHGDTWTGNSSFGELEGVSAQPVGRWRDRLDPSTIAFVDAVCGPELDHLGYHRTAMSAHDEDAAISGFREPMEVDHPRFDPGYSSSIEAIDVERRRLALLRGSPAGVDLRDWFVFPEVHGVLRQAVAT